MSAFASTLGKGLHGSSMSWSSWWGGAEEEEDVNSQCIGQHMVCISLQQIQK